MIQMIEHRGPDDTGTYVDGPVGLGHTRLSIIDLADGRQPMEAEDGSLCIVFNGEIFNYIELREELVRKGHRFRTRSDTEVILHLFEEMGEECVTRLNGQWAFAIWNRRTQRLFLSRDRMGVRPLFYTYAGGALVFASEIKALFAYPGVRRALDLPALDQIFTFWHTIPPRTAFEGVFELPPGYNATVAGGTLSAQPYWELRYKETDGAAAPDDDQAQREQLLHLLKDATRIRLRADVPVGAYLSGGLDSTVITALAKQLAPHRLKTFSVRFEDAEFDEGDFQKAAVGYLGTEHQDLRCSARQIGEVFPDVIWHTEKPVLRTAPAPLYLLSKLVRNHGYKVVLTGEGADELLGGYDIFKELKIRRFCAAHPESPSRPLLLRRLYPYLKELGSQPAGFLNAFFQAGPNEVGEPFFSHLPRWRVTGMLKSFFTEDVQAEITGGQACAELEQQMPAGYSGWEGFRRAEYLEARYLMPGYILSSQGDRVAMAHSVEARFPFLDHRVVEFAAALPPAAKMKGLQEKYLLKQSVQGLVPPAVSERHKQPYRAPEARSFFPKGQPLDYVADLLTSEQLRQDGIFEPAAVQSLMKKACEGRIIGIRDNMAVVGIISTALLMRRFLTNFSLDQQGGRDLKDGYHGKFAAIRH